MMAGNPNWWSMMTNNGMHPQSQQLSNSHSFIYGGSNSPPPPLSPNPPSPAPHHHHPDHDFPVRSWSQMLLGGLGGEEEERFGASLFQQQKKLENWEEQLVFNNFTNNINTRVINNNPIVDVKQEVVAQSTYGRHVLLQDDGNHQFQANNNYSNSTNWPININISNNNNNNNNSHHQVMPVSSPTSCITTLSNNILNFSGGKQAATATQQRKNQQHNQDHSSESNSTNSGGVSKKARVQQSSAQPALKVRKEKLGDRITALHQLVSPFGKTDTASVLSEAIGYIRFLQGQIEALSSPYMRNPAGNTVHHQHSVQERNCVYPEENCQFLNDFGVEARGAAKQELESRQVVNDLRSRGLCLVPISCTQNVGNDNAADYWAPAALGGGGF
ncbi:hypothetical protein ABFX02_09G106100 [Erythranthe guttata]